MLLYFLRYNMYFSYNLGVSCTQKNTVIAQFLSLIFAAYYTDTCIT